MFDVGSFPKVVDQVGHTQDIHGTEITFLRRGGEGRGGK